MKALPLSQATHLRKQAKELSQELTNGQTEPGLNPAAEAMVWACQHFRPYLAGRHFTLRTDHQPLTSLNRVQGQALERLCADLFRSPVNPRNSGVPAEEDDQAPPRDSGIPPEPESSDDSDASIGGPKGFQKGDGETIMRAIGSGVGGVAYSRA